MKQLDPKSVWLFFISFLSRWFFFIIPLTFFLILSSSNGNRGKMDMDIILSMASVAIPVLLFLCCLISFVWAKLTYHYYRYELTENGFRKELGVIYKKYVTIPYDRIQNVDIYRGIWARILGLSDLNIQTAGSSAVVNRQGAIGISAEGRLPGLSKEIAEELRDELINRARQSKNQGI